MLTLGHFGVVPVAIGATEKGGTIFLNVDNDPDVGAEKRIGPMVVPLTRMPRPPASCTSPRRSRESKEDPKLRVWYRRTAVLPPIKGLERQERRRHFGHDCVQRRSSFQTVKLCVP